MNKRVFLRRGLFLLVISFIFVISPKQVTATEPIDINSASYSELQKISGVGPVIAQRIIDSRPYESLDDLLKVKGIGEVVLLKIKQQGLAHVSEESVLAIPTQLNEVFTGKYTAKSMASVLNKEVTDLVNQEELDGIDTVWLEYYSQFDSLEGFQYLHNLKTFSGYSLGVVSRDEFFAETFDVPFGAEGVTDLSPLKKLKKIESFLLYAGEFKDISALSQCKNLASLDLSGSTELNNIEAVENFSELKSLSLTGITTINNYTPVAKLSKLENLALSGNELEDISFISTLYKLLTVDFSNNNVTSLTPFKELTDLQDVNLAENEILDIDALGNLIKLKSLNLNENRINNVSALIDLTLLESLSVMKNNLESLNGIQHMEQLNYLNASNNKLRNLNELENVTYVNLWLHDNQISDINGLRNLQFSEDLDLSKNKITNLTPLASLISVNHFGLSDNNISDVSPLQNMQWVGGLSLRENPISDFSPISHLYYYL